MKTFQIKQKMWSLGGKFIINDELGMPTYQVEGSLFKIPKTFTIADMSGNQVGKIEKRVWAFLPKFDVNLANGQIVTIKKDFSFFKPHYSLENLNMEVQGNFWDMNFNLLQNGQIVARISQEWFRMTSTYNIEVYNEAYCDLVIALTVAIDYVKAQESGVAASSASN
ncbi:LURP-one-related/scramblase family protein [Streptococcus dentasini]